MKHSPMVSFLGFAALAQAQWWAGAPDCAHDCFSSFWSSSTAWPAPTSYCSATQGASVTDCIQSACSAAPTAVTSYSSLSSSLCSKWSSCSDAGSTGVYTVTAQGGYGAWPHRGSRSYNDNDGRNGHDWDNDGSWDFDGDGTDDRDEWSSGWRQWGTRTWTGGVYTVTGCEWEGNVWAGGPQGYSPSNPNGGSPWGPWGHGWTHTTVTETVTKVITVTSDDGVTALSTSVGLATVAKAVSGDVTSTSLVGEAGEPSATGSGSGGASETGSGSGSEEVTGAAAGRGEGVGVKAMGAVLAGVVVGAVLL